MGFAQAFKLAFKSLAGSKMRAFLTILGIIIGVGSVIILVSLMQGMTGEVTSMFEDMGTNMLTVSVTGRGSSRTVDVDDMYALYEENTDVFMGMSPMVSITGTVKTSTDSDSFDSTTVSGVSEQYAEIYGYQLQDGRFISYADLEARSKVAVVGTYVANMLGGNAVGQTIKVNGNALTVVGVIEEQDDSTEGSSDDCIYLPYTTASKLTFGEISTYTFATWDSSMNEEGTTLIDNTLYEVFENEDYYTISDMQEMVDEKKLPVNTAADISYLKPDEQKKLADAMKREDKVPSGTQAAELKKESQAGKLTTEKIEKTVAPTKREENPELKVTFTNDELRPYFPKKDTTVGDVKRVVFESLTLRQKAMERQQSKAAPDNKKPRSKPDLSIVK